MRLLLIAAILIGCGGNGAVVDDADPGVDANPTGTDADADADADAAPADAAVPDSRVPDAAPPVDAAVPDAAPPDAAIPDATPPDAAPPDANVECDPGTVWNGAECADIDECALAPCSPRATCTNTPGSFSCACRGGFSGDGFTCADVDECVGDPCGPGDVCSNTPGGFTCAPAIVDECAAGTDECSPNATCTDTAEGYTCTCAGGTIGDGRICQRAYGWFGLGTGHGCAREGSAMRCWGDNYYYELGIATAPDAPAPVPTPGAWLQADLYDSSTCGIRGDGTWHCWGRLIAYLQVSQFGSDTDWEQASAGLYHTCAIKSDRTLWCAGWNGYGELGDGTSAAEVVETPVQVAGTDWRALELGGNHSCAIDGDGALWCWGMNYWGQLGVGDNVDRHEPTRVGTDLWLAVSAADTWTCGLRSDGAILCWGDHFSGHLGTDDPPDPYSTGRFAPTPIEAAGPFVDLDVERTHACALRVDGSLWCWGESLYGSLLLEENAVHSLPVAVDAGDGWVDVEVGGHVTCAQRADGTVHCWGSDSSGQLGGGEGGQRWSPTAVMPGTTWRALDSRGYHGCAIRDDGSLWCWGYNGFGELGDGTRIARDAPIQVGAATDWIGVATGLGHTCGLRAPDRLSCWGEDYGDQPVAIPGSWRAASVSRFETCALDADRRLWCWRNAAAPTPALVGLDAVESFQTGHIHACAIQAGGALSCWGQNHRGQLADGTYTARVTPAPVSGGGPYRAVGVEHSTTLASDGGLLVGAGHRYYSPLFVDAGAGGDYAAISSGNYHSCGLHDDGRITCVGGDEDGQLGDGEAGYGGGIFTHAGVWSRVSAGLGDISCALDATGALWCWGANWYGGIGDGDAWRSTITAVTD